MNTLPPSMLSADQGPNPMIPAIAKPGTAARQPVKHRSRCAGDEGAPLSDGAIVRMKLSRRTDLDLVNWVGNHLRQMDDNPNFPDPQPPALVLEALFDAFSSDMANVQAAKTALEMALTACDASRTALLQGMQVRGAYVQAASNGNTNVIINSGLEVRDAPSPIGKLPPPINLQIELNGVLAWMKLSWQRVKNARGYLVECSEDVMPRVWRQIKNTSKSRLVLHDMEVGKTWVFRVASQGGSTGQSSWSAEATRGAA